MRALGMVCLGLLMVGVLAEPVQAQKKAKIDELMKELDGKNADSRIAALAEIGKLAEVKRAWGKMAQPQVLDMLTKDKDARIRSAALACLGKIEPDPKDYVANMMKYLKEDKDFAVQGAALGLIAQYAQEAEPAIKPLQDRLAELREANKDQDPGNIRSAIMNTLVQVNQGLDQPLALEALQKDKAVSVKQTAVGRLTQIAQQRRIPDTAPLLLKTYEESLEAGPSPDLRRGILGALALIQPDPKNYKLLLVETLKKDKDSASVVAVIAALSRGGEASKEVIALVLDAQKTVIASAPKDGSDPNGQRRILVESIAKFNIEPKELVPVLLDTVKKDRDAAVRAAALGGLAALGTKAKDAAPTVSAMVKANTVWGAKDGNDPSSIRAVTLQTLAKLEPEPKGFVTVLTDVVRRDRNPEVRLAAVKLLGDVGAPAKSALPLLKTLQKVSKTTPPPEKAIAAAAAEATEKINGGK